MSLRLQLLKSKGSQQPFPGAYPVRLTSCSLPPVQSWGVRTEDGLGSVRQKWHADPSATLSRAEEENSGQESFAEEPRIGDIENRWTNSGRMFNAEGRTHLPPGRSARLEEWEVVWSGQSHLLLYLSELSFFKKTSAVVSSCSRVCPLRAAIPEFQWGVQQYSRSHFREMRQPCLPSEEAVSLSSKEKEITGMFIEERRRSISSWSSAFLAHLSFSFCIGLCTHQKETEGETKVPPLPTVGHDGSTAHLPRLHPGRFGACALMHPACFSSCWDLN